METELPIYVSGRMNGVYVARDGLATCPEPSFIYFFVFFLAAVISNLRLLLHSKKKKVDFWFSLDSITLVLVWFGLSEAGSYSWPSK